MIDILKLVCVKPIRGKEHRKEEYYVGIVPKCLPEAEDLRLPSWVFHQDNSRPITTHDMLSINQCPRQAGSKECEDQEADIGAITDCDFLVRVDV
jgi:hypothetical protein